VSLLALVSGGLVAALRRSRARTAELVESSEHLRAELEWRGMRDPLTELPNRAWFDERLEQAAGRSRRAGGSIAVLFIDLDGFKRVNDTRGHLAGDRLLAQVGRRLAGSVRAGDSVARYGGDEFTVLCEDVRSADEPVAAARRISAALEKPFRLGGAGTAVHCSIGIAVSAGGEETPVALVGAADAAMYRAKAKRRAYTLAEAHAAAA
jgi:diguanylate cyclase (GGDEF)-like protein